MTNSSNSSILIVDDAETNIDILVNVLDDDYDIMVATNGVEALEVIQKDLPDLILLDIMMPEMDGYEVCRRLKQDPATKAIPIIFLTAMDRQEDEAKGLALGAADYIVKPFSTAIVRQRIALHLKLYDQNRTLEKKVKQRTAALQKALKNLQTTRVTTGVYWVQVPEAGLYILCGCPEEIVKHMMTKGYIETVCQGDITYETGPNAILLSDVLIQNGCFSNLAEFPVLQMLYRQGLILPGHPNNTGEKPILIGSRDQIGSQKEYIFRGNFGLIDESEFIEAGASQEWAAEMMRLKNKFRFGQTPDMDTLLDTRIVETKPVEIKNGVYVKRVSLNVYEFSYKGRTTQVDLNLGPRETYPCPYHLGHHRITREYFAVIHSGEGDGWNTMQPSMGSILVFQGGIYLIDMPPNILYILRSLGIDISEIIGIFHTHAHDDHFVSLPTLMRSDHRIKYYTTPLVRASVSKKFSALLSMDETALGRFFEFHDLAFDQWNDCGGLEVKPVFSPHPVETNIFLFRALGGDGYKTYAHFADIISLDLLKKMTGKDPGCIRESTFQQIKKAYLQPVDIKKLDAGGGMIHGQASDFKHDPSKKVILAHTEGPLSDAQKEIGSESSFGQVDVLIPGCRDFLRHQALTYLESFFPGIDAPAVNTLLNADIIEFNPGTIILKKDEIPNRLYMVLTGTVEYLNTGANIHNSLSNGSFIGESNLFRTSGSKGVFRAVSHVAAMSFSFDFFKHFLKRQDLFEQSRQLVERSDFLKSTWLFGEGCSYGLLNKTAQHMELVSLEKDTIIPDPAEPALFLIKSGSIRMSDLHNKDIEELKTGHFFGEHHFFTPAKASFTFTTMHPCDLYAIKGTDLLNIPIVLWKLLEIHDRRKKMYLSLTNRFMAPDLDSW